MTKPGALALFSLAFLLLSCTEASSPSGDSGEVQNDLVSTAVEIIRGGTSNFSAIEVSVEQGAAADPDTKKGALKKAIESLPGFAPLGVTTEASNVTGEQWALVVFNCCASTSKTINRVVFSDTQSAAAVASAKTLLTASLPALKTIYVTGGEAADLAAKQKAIAGNIEAIPDYAALLVNTEAAPDQGGEIGNGSAWTVTISKAASSETFPLTVSGGRLGNAQRAIVEREIRSVPLTGPEGRWPKCPRSHRFFCPFPPKTP